MPTNLMWDFGHDIIPILNTIVTVDGWKVLEAACDSLLGNGNLVNSLRTSKFDVTIVDLFFNDCGLALAHDLSVPVVGFGNFQALGLHFESLVTHPSHVPMLMSGLTENMNFLQRVRNMGYKLFHKGVMAFHYWRMDRFIRMHIPNSPSSSWVIL